MNEGEGKSEVVINFKLARQYVNSACLGVDSGRVEVKSYWDCTSSALFYEVGGCNLMKSRVDFQVLTLPTANDWLVVLPKCANIDLNFMQRASEIAENAQDANRLYCGAGLAPFSLSIETKSLVSFCFDQINASTQSSTQIRVSVVLESPIVLPRDFVKERLSEPSLTFIDLLSIVNREVQSFKICAEAHSSLAFGLDHKLKAPKPHSSNFKSTERDAFSKSRTLTVITRTTGSRNDLLVRCVESVSKFANQLVDLKLEHLIIYSGNKPQITASQNLILIRNQSDKLSSRLAGLISGISAAQGDYLLFLDDDDFVESDLANDVEKILNFDDTARITFFDSQQIFESRKLKKGRPRKGHRYSASNGMGSYFGPNKTPISSVIYPKNSLVQLEKISDISQFPSVLEDHLLLMIALMDYPHKPAYYSKVLTWISIHGRGQTVIDQETNEWAASIANLRRVMVEVFSSVDKEYLLENSNLIRPAKINGQRLLIRMLGIASPASWRTLLYFQVPKKLITGRVTLGDLWNKYLSH